MSLCLFTSGVQGRSPWPIFVAAALLLLSALVAPASAGQRVALVIGNASYAHAPSLANPFNDATDIGAALERLGFDVTLLENADYDAMRRGLRGFTRAAATAEIAIVIYAGHGIEVDKRNFLIPVDARLLSDREVEFETVSLDLVSRAVEGASGLGLVILDACRDNPFAVAMQRSGGTRSIGRGLASVEPAGETLVAYAAKGGSVAADGVGRNSPYTTALLAHLEEPGLEIGLMFRKVRDAVLAATGRQQEPFVYGSLSSEGFYFSEPPATVTSVPGGKVEDIAKSDEQLFWESVMDSRDSADLQAYLEQFPRGVFATLARNRLKRLDDPQEEKPDVQVAITPDEPERVVSPEPAAPTPEVVEASLGLERAERRQIQMGLASLGFDPGPADGLFGRGTRGAIGRWQSSRGGEATGHLDAETAKLLMEAGKEAARRRATMRPGRVFRDCPECPEMVVVSAGSFMMGSPSSEEGRYDDEGPQHRVTIAAPFAVGKYEVTRGEFALFIEATGHYTGNACWAYEHGEWEEGSGRGWRNPGYLQAERHPVACVSWEDAKAYVRWLSRMTGERYRLLSEAEWEYAARAGTRTSRYWGDDAWAQCDHANGYDRTARAELDWDREPAPCRDGSVHTARIGSYRENGFGLSDMLGNVWEWVEDCRHDSYASAPTDGSAWVSGGDCGERVIRGGSWISSPRYLRPAVRGRYPAEIRYYYIGFRVSRTFTP